MSLTVRVAERVRALTLEGPCLVAVSGGTDSLALLDLLVQSRTLHDRELVVAHVDHGINPQSGEIATRVHSLARGLGLRCLIRRLSLGAQASETIARRARRAALAEIAHEVGADTIILAHQADDQIETILMRLLRGSGPAGLAGMAFRQGPILRPLLDVSRAELHQHLIARGLTAWDDPANHDPVHLRSWLRGEILPLLRARLPDLDQKLLASGRQARQQRDAWDEVPEMLVELALEQDCRSVSVAVRPLQEYSSGLRGVLLGTLARRFGVLLGERRLQALEKLLTLSGGRIDLAAGLIAELAFDRLILRYRAGYRPQMGPLETGRRWGDWLVEVTPGEAGDVTRRDWTTWLEPGAYLVRGWEAGDRIRPLRGRGSRPVSVLLKESKVAPGFRDQWPLVTDESGGEILWVPGVCRSEVRVPARGAGAIHVEFRRERVAEIDPKQNDRDTGLSTHTQGN